MNMNLMYSEDLRQNNKVAMLTDFTKRLHSLVAILARKFDFSERVEERPARADRSRTCLAVRSYTCSARLGSGGAANCELVPISLLLLCELFKRMGDKAFMIRSRGAPLFLASASTALDGRPLEASVAPQPFRSPLSLSLSLTAARKTNSKPDQARQSGVAPECNSCMRRTVRPSLL